MRVSVICGTRQGLKRKNEYCEENVKVKVRAHKYVECPICGEMTLDRLHYGGLACKSCKAFFRRIVVVHKTPRRPCRQLGQCLLKKQKRNNCPACRFQRCLESGLRPEQVLSGRPEAQRQGRKVKSVISQERREVLATPPPPASPSRLLATYSLSPDLIEDPWASIMASHRLVLSQTAGVNLMMVPGEVVTALGERLREEERRGEATQEVLTVARIEHAFLVAKECVAIFTESLTLERLAQSKEQGIYTALVFTSVQVRRIGITRSNCETIKL